MSRSARPVIIAPNPARRLSRSFVKRAAATGKVGQRIAELCDVSYKDYLQMFERRFLINYWPGPATDGKGYAWPAGEASASAKKLIEKYKGRDIVLLGRHVSRSFFPHWMRYEARPDYFDWLTIDEEGSRWAVCPTPNDMNSWWRGRQNLKRAKFFWSDLVCKS